MQSSIHEVIITLSEAAFLVLLVVFVFLQSWRATLIPIVAVPVSLIGAFGGLMLFGFTLNTLTLFAIVLATGIVVDDAIVVLENVERLMAEKKLSPRQAAIESMREVTGAIIAIELVLVSVAWQRHSASKPQAFVRCASWRLPQRFVRLGWVSISFPMPSVNSPSWASSTLWRHRLYLLRNLPSSIAVVASSGVNLGA